MGTYAVAEKHWDEESLSTLPVENGFRLRGLEVTRLDTFVDAAFAFVLTLLVISFDDIPSNYAEIVATITKIPAFMVSFTVLMAFWLSHRSWSRRYGLENKATLVLSLSLIFTILVYVYPLRMVFESMFSWLSDGRLSSTIDIGSPEELPLLFNFYSGGFLVMSVILALLYEVTLRKKQVLCLSDIEQARTKDAVRAWWICAGFAVLSLVVANLMTAIWVTTAGWIYLLLYPTILAVNWLNNR